MSADVSSYRMSTNQKQPTHLEMIPVRILFTGVVQMSNAQRSV